MIRNSARTRPNVLFDADVRSVQSRVALRFLRFLALLFFCAVASIAAVARAQPPPAQPPRAQPPPAQPSPVVPPKLVSDATVPYPEGATGDVTILVLLVVGADGAVESATAEGGSEPFASAAVNAARAWRYEPATRDGKPVRARIRVAIDFHPPVEEEVKEEEPKPEDAKPPAPGATTAPPKPPPAPGPDEVTVRGARAEPSRTVSLTRTEVRQIPGAFGDPFRAIEMMPGVTPVVSGLPFFFIRGAPPGNVGYYLDGVRIPLLFHVGAGPSVVHPGLIQRVDLYPGGYPARFGRFSGGIVSGETTQPAKELHGEYNVRLFDAGALVETPFANKRGTVLLGGRYSYTAALLTQLSSDTVLDYWDYQVRSTYDLTPDDTIGVFAFGSYDYLGQIAPSGEELTVFGTEFHRVDARYDRRLGRNGSVRIAVTAGMDRSRAMQNRFVRDRLVGARSEWNYLLSERALFRAGTDVQVDSYDIQVSGELPPSTQRVAAFFPKRTDLALGARADTVIALTRELEVTPGARVDLYASQGATEVAVDPRLALRTIVTPRIKVLSALGIAHQPPSFVVPVPGSSPEGCAAACRRPIRRASASSSISASRRRRRPRCSTTRSPT